MTNKRNLHWNIREAIMSLSRTVLLTYCQGWKSLVFGWRYSHDHQKPNQMWSRTHKHAEQSCLLLCLDGIFCLWGFSGKLGSFDWELLWVIWFIKVILVFHVFQAFDRPFVVNHAENQPICPANILHPQPLSSNSSGNRLSERPGEADKENVLRVSIDQVCELSLCHNFKNIYGALKLAWYSMRWWINTLPVYVHLHQLITSQMLFS